MLDKCRLIQCEPQKLKPYPWSQHQTLICKQMFFVTMQPSLATWLFFKISSCVFIVNILYNVENDIMSEFIAVCVKLQERKVSLVKWVPVFMWYKLFIYLTLPLVMLINLFCIVLISWFLINWYYNVYRAKLPLRSFFFNVSEILCNN